MSVSKDSRVDQFIAPQTIKRLARDVRAIQKNPLDSNGIFYIHDEENILKGYALIVGPKDTIYENGFYFFEIEYPADYPQTPPKLVFKTNKNLVRFNPNLYTNGKVCLSILNTWRGEQWTACQTISTVLLTVCTVFNNDPLLNEPGIGKGHRDMKSYNRIIEFKNVEIAILDILTECPKIYTKMFDKFSEVVKNQFIQNIHEIRKRIQKMIRAASSMSHVHSNSSSEGLRIVAKTDMYTMKFELNYTRLLSRFEEIAKKYEDTSVDITTITSKKVSSRKKVEKKNKVISSEAPL
tara:strand:- start:15955 stop:16836 length:882 start_codon:yes stop_codon:yes gene_type:complete